jgi:hypothetical protein
MLKTPGTMGIRISLTPMNSLSSPTSAMSSAMP